MSNYTMELRKVCDIYTYEEVKSWFTSYNLEDYLTETQIQTITETNIWNKERLAEKIINHYFMREIGFETPYLFRHFAKTKMSEIMEKYLPLIYSKSIEFNPLVNVDFVEEYTKDNTGSNVNNQTHSDTENITEDKSVSNSGTSTNTGTSSSTSTNNSSGLNVNSDTPQGQITKANILAGNYASSTSANENTASIVDNTQTSNNGSASNTETTDNEIEKTNSGSINSTGSNTNKETFRRTMHGNSGSITTAQHLIQQYRDIIVAVDEEIINELNSLFIGLF